MAIFRRLLADPTGTSAMEYGLICGLLVIGPVAGVDSLGAEVGSSYTSTSTAIHLANSH